MNHPEVCFWASVKGAKSAVIGPAQLQAKQRILNRAEANKKLRDRRRIEQRKAATAPATGGFTFTPLPFPTQP